MGTVLYEKDGEELVKRYAGGPLGVCFSLSINDSMTKEEFVEFLSECIKGLDL